MTAALEIRRRLRYRLGTIRLFVARLGLRSAIVYWTRRHRPAFDPRRRVFTLRAREAAHPLRCRAGTSDLDVFRQIFIQREHAWVESVSDAQLIVDCGANAGYASAYFLSRFPQADLIAVEPDGGNFELLVRNLRPYGKRAMPLRAGVWSHAADLVIDEKPYRDSREWARQVRPAKPGEASDLRGVDVATLLRDSGHKTISVLKLDIEGAEAVVFSENYDSWLGLVENMVIELHDDSSFGAGSATFERAIAGQSFRLTRLEGLTLCVRETNARS